MQNPANRRYITGFDGLRALAVVGVITFHLWPMTIQGGWLGVPLFFVLSGYLITDILIQEYERNQRIDILGFYRRRLKRLYPALLVMLLATATYIGLFARDLLYNLRAILLTNLTYVYNFWATKHGDSYFDSWGGASPFTHLWSLSIEGQFYFVWPIVVFLLLRLKVRRDKVTIGLFALAIVSAFLMGIYYNPTDINRAYYGTDTRLFAILLGTALAFVWPSNHLRLNLSKANRKMLNFTGLGAFVIVMLAFLFLDGQSGLTYYGLMFVMTILIAFLIAVTAHPDSWFSKWLDNPVLNYLGTRSYSIYLYQLPVFVFVDRLTQNNSSVPLQLFKIAIVLGLSELSYRYIENVFRRFKKVALGQQPLLRLKQSRGLQIAAAVAIIFIVGTANAISAKAAGQPKPKTTLEKTLAANKSKIDAANKKAEAAAKAAKSSTATSTSSESASSSQASSQSSEVSTANDPIAVKYGLTDAELAKVKGIAMTAVGDSVMLDVAPDLQEAMPATVVDGQVGRQTASVPGVLQSIANRGALANTVLITIGTNGSISAKNIDDIMAIIGATRRVYWVTPYADRVWIPGNMYELNQALQRYSNLTLIDWKALVEKDNNRATWLGADGVHPNQAGDLAYASLVVKDIANAQ